MLLLLPPRPIRWVAGFVYSLGTGILVLSRFGPNKLNPPLKVKANDRVVRTNGACLKVMRRERIKKNGVGDRKKFVSRGDVFVEEYLAQCY
jgi:hypothetical protein